MSSDLIDQLENFKDFIDQTDTVIVSNIDMRRKYYMEHPSESKKPDLYNQSVDTFKNIVIAFIQLNNNNASKTITKLNTLLSTSRLDQKMWNELIVKITNSIISSNLTVTNTKQNHAKIIGLIEKYNAGFLAAFLEYQLSIPFSIEMLDCLMYIYMEFEEIEKMVLEYMSKGGKDSLTELLKFINLSPTVFQTLYTKHTDNITELTGYMRYIIDEINNKLSLI